MTPRTKSSVLWGVVGALSFLVLAQGYRLFGIGRITFPVMVGVALVVGIVATALAHVVGGGLR